MLLKIKNYFPIPNNLNQVMTTTTYFGKRKKCFLFILIFSCCSAVLLAQTDTTETLESNLGPKVFLDCNFCDITYIKQNVPYVNYVRDRKVADGHVLYIQQRTGSGGMEFRLYSYHYLR